MTDITSDFHMHTSFSNDSKSSPEQMVLGAIKKGMKIICFTDHQDKDYSFEGTEAVYDTGEYFRILEKLQYKYKEQIEVRIGVELGLQPHLGAYYKKYVHQYPFDFVIGSVHLIMSKDPYFDNFFIDHTDSEAYKIAFKQTLEDIQGVDDFDVLGHLDYIVRYGKEKDKEYSYAKYATDIDEILKHLINHGKGIELNTAGFKYGLSFAHPHPEVLKRYKELGGEILTIGADGHKPEHIGYDFHRVSDILQECGFKYYTEFKDRKPIFKQLP
ncbi:MAG: histidinol-phosphatase HisJ family protein [Lachnospiraceae bacterium]